MSLGHLDLLFGPSGPMMLPAWLSVGVLAAACPSGFGCWHWGVSCGTLRGKTFPPLRGDGFIFAFCVMNERAKQLSVEWRDTAEESLYLWDGWMRALDSSRPRHTALAHISLSGDSCWSILLALIIRLANCTLVDVKVST